MGVDPRYYRPAAVETLLGDPSIAKAGFGWVSNVAFAELVRKIVEADCGSAERDHLVKQAGYLAYGHYE